MSSTSSRSESGSGPGLEPGSSAEQSKAQEVSGSSPVSAQALLEAPRPALTSPLKSRSVKKKKQQENVEHSLPLRCCALVMTIFLITGTCLYLKLDFLITFLLIWVAVVGVVLSHVFREKRPFWYHFLSGLGAITVVAVLIWDLYNQWQSRSVDLLTSFSQALAGLLALHCFDLRTRADFSICAAIAVALLVCISGKADDYLFVLWIFGYFSILAAMLYYDTVSRSRALGPSRPVSEGRPASMPPLKRKLSKASSVVVIVSLASLPIMTILMSFSLPRSDSMVRWFMENVVMPSFAISNSERNSGLSPRAVPIASSNSAAGSAGGNKSGDRNAITPGSGEGSESGSISGTGAEGEKAPAFVEGETEPGTVDLLDTSMATDQLVLKFTAAKADYSRCLSFDYYDGQSWSRKGTIKEVRFNKQNDDPVFPVGNANALRLPSECPYVEVEQTVTIEKALQGSFVSCFWSPQAVAGTFKTASVQADGSIVSSEPLAPGLTYKVRSFVPVLRLSEMESMSASLRSDFKPSLLGEKYNSLKLAEEALFGKYLQLPPDYSNRVVAHTAKILNNSSGANNFQKAMKLQEHLRSKQYEYKQDNAFRLKDGDSVENFLFKSREGNCKDYASAFVIMARCSGVPARLVSGYLPGKYNERTGFWEVKVRDSHAWAEIYMPNWGWIPFDPSPNGDLPHLEAEGGLAAMLAKLGLANPFGDLFQKRPRPAPGVGLGEGISGSRMEKEAAKEDKPDSSGGKESNSTDEEGESLDHSALTVFILSFVLVSGLVLAWVLWQQHRPGENARLPVNSPRAALIYMDLVNSLRRYKVVRLATDTPDDVSRKLAFCLEERRSSGREDVPELEPLVAEFMHLYSLTRFGRGERIDELDALGRKIKLLIR